MPRLRLPAIAALGASAAPTASCTITAAPRTPAQTPNPKPVKQPARSASAAVKAGPPPPVAVPELAVAEGGGRAAETPGSATTAATADSPFGVMQAEGKLTPQRMAALTAASEQVGLTAPTCGTPTAVPRRPVGSDTQTFMATDRRGGSGAGGAQGGVLHAKQC